MKRLALILVIFLLFLVNFVSAATYADVKITASSDGNLVIDGLTNYDGFENFEVGDYLARDGKYWLLNITTDTVFSDAVYTITLPEDATINYMKIPDLITISSKNNKLSILGKATNQKVNILVQYTTKSGVKGYWWLVLIMVALIVGFVVFKYLTRSDFERLSNYDALTPRQKQIVKIILKEKNNVTQAQIEKETNIPKSSLSRNINSLIRKGLIRKEQSGMTNKLYMIKEEKKTDK